MVDNVQQPYYDESMTETPLPDRDSDMEFIRSLLAEGSVATQRAETAAQQLLETPRWKVFTRQQRQKEVDRRIAVARLIVDQTDMLINRLMDDS